MKKKTEIKIHMEEKQFPKILLNSCNSMEDALCILNSFKLNYHIILKGFKSVLSFLISDTIKALKD